MSFYCDQVIVVIGSIYLSTAGLDSGSNRKMQTQTVAQIPSRAGPNDSNNGLGPELNSPGVVNQAFVSDSEELKALHKSTAVNISVNAVNLEKPKKKHWILRRIYFLTWIRTYNKQFAIADLIAGVTIGLTIIPQSIAYAALAGLPSQYGLYAAFMGSLVYVFFGTIKEVSIGPTSLMALLTLQYTYNKPVEFAIILAFLAGVVELLMGLLKLGFIVDFISDPVTSAFTSATAIIIIGSQVKNLLGITFPSKGFTDSMIQLAHKITDTTLGDGLLGLFCIIFLISLRQINQIPMKTDTRSKQILKKVLWYISISRNALAVITTSVIAYVWTSKAGGRIPFRLSANVESGVPSFQPPPFEITSGNQTYTIVDICSEFGSGIIVVPLVAVLANVAIAKAFATGGTIDASQEMLTLGLCNLIGSFFCSMPTCGAFTRSAVSQASGVKTPMAGIYSGTLVILALSLLTPYFHYIPKSTLAAVLICAVVFMIDFKIVLRLWKECKRDLIGWFGCFIVCLSVGVEIGLFFGILLNVLHLLYRWARPKTQVKLKEIDNMQYIYIAPDSGIFFPGVDYLRAKVSSACAAANYQVPVVIDCSRISGLDYTSAQGFHNLADELEKNKVVLILKNMEPSLQKYIDNSNQLLFCSKEAAIKEILTQESIRKGKIPLEEYIRASIDLEYKVEPDGNATKC